MIERYINILKQLRAGEVDIRNFYYKKSINQEGYDFDEHQIKRFQLLIALQYDRTPNDQPLLQELLKQEIKAHRNNPFQGLFPSIQLNSFLLSEYRNPENVWLFLEAKRANFDTHCGYDREYLLSAGIRETFAFLDESANSSKGDFYEYTGKSLESLNCTEDDLDIWKNEMSILYSDKPKLDHIEDYINLAIDLDEKEILKEKIMEWSGLPRNWNDQTLHQLSYYQGLIGNIEGQISANERLYEIKTTDWDKASWLQSLSQLYIKANNPDLAWERIKMAQPYLKQISNWKDIGLGKFIVENAFEVVISIDDSGNLIAREAFRWGIEQIQNMSDLHFNLLEKIGKAAELMGDNRSRDKFLEIFAGNR